MNALLQSIGSETSDSEIPIPELKEDCLWELLAFLDVGELAAITDVCTRFRKNAEQCAHSESEHLVLDRSSTVCDYSKLRLFGPLFKSIEVDGTYSGESRLKFQKQLIELINLYCKDAEHAIDLKLVEYDITDEIAELIIPLLARVRKLHISHCEHSKSILIELPSWAPELRELTLHGSLDWQYDDERVALFESLRQKFPKLETFTFLANEDVENIDIEEFLKHNPQLKKIHLSYCDKIDEGIFRSIAEYVPEIEEIWFLTRLVSSVDNIKYFSQLRALKSLTLQAYSLDHQYTPLVVHELASANIPLECLDLFEFGEFRHNDQQFMEDISKMQQLKTLRLYRIQHFTVRHLIEICKHLKELTEIDVHRMDLKMSKDDLLELMENAEKLHKFNYRKWEGERAIIDVDTFQKLVNILAQRREKIKLNLVLNNYAFTLDNNIPEELIKDASDLLKIEIESLYINSEINL